MTIALGLAAELGLLSQALDLPGTDVAETLTRLAADAGAGVDAYLGLSVAIKANGSEFELTLLEQGAQREHVRTSLHVPLSSAKFDASSTASVSLILYASRPGAFIDLAADLSWITGRSRADLQLDEHCDVPKSGTKPTALGAMSSINQAIGVLIGRGSTPEQAERDLHQRAADAGIDLFGAANLILAAVSPTGREPEGH